MPLLPTVRFLATRLIFSFAEIEKGAIIQPQALPIGYWETVERRMQCPRTMSMRQCFYRSARWSAGVFILTTPALLAQTMIQGSGPAATVRILNTDAAVLESQEVRKDLPCTVTPMKSALGFDLRFHAGYEVNVPLKELAGAENMLTMIFRVIRDNHKDEPLYFTQRFSVPAIEENAKGEAYLQGTFEVGEGKYHVDWLMRDRTERVCANF